MEHDVKQLSTIKKNKKGQMIHRKQRETIINMYKKFKESDPKMKKKEIVSQVIAHTGLGRTSIQRTILFYERTNTVFSPNRKKRRLSVHEKIDEAHKNAIRRKIFDFYSNQELPTVDKVMKAVNDDPNLPDFKRTTFSRVLKELLALTEKELRTSGLEESSRSNPSSLSMDVWHLTENLKGNDCEADNSIESSEDASCSSLGKEMDASTDFLIHEIKVEKPDNYELETTDEEQKSIQEDVHEMNNENHKSGISKEMSVNLRKQKRLRLDDQIENCINRDIDKGPSENKTYQNTADSVNHLTSKERADWLFEASQKEYNLKLKILNTELEKVELQKKTALSEWRTAEVKRKLAENQEEECHSQIRMSGEPGSGAGKGGGGGGSIREAGGAFGKMEAAREDQYFHNQQAEQLKKLRAELYDEVSFHEEQIKRHQEAISRHKRKINEMENNGIKPNRSKSDASKDKFSEKNVAYESEYYYKQNKELLKLVKQRLQDEVILMQDEVQNMKEKIEDYKRDINENLRFLKGLEKDLSATGKKDLD